MAMRALEEDAGPDEQAPQPQPHEAAPVTGLPPLEGSTRGELAFVPEPRDVQETGLGLRFLTDLLAKAVYYGADPTPLSLSEQLRLPIRVISEVLSIMRQQMLIDVQGSAGMGERQYIYALTDKGNRRASEALERSQYVGPAPVPFERYIEVQAHQAIAGMKVSPEEVRSALGKLVLPDPVINSIGAALTSTKSVLIYGESGNGKSSITSAMRGMLPGQILIPHALDVAGQIVRVLDERVHERVAEPPKEERHADDDEGANPITILAERRRDKRFAVCRRPVVTLGGELTLDDLELHYSHSSRFYVAPPQVKANGGILVVDDFGRQIAKPRELLNRWITPMEAGVDQLSFQSGESIQVPFNIMVVFSTNLAPRDLGDEAFFRRIRHKVAVPNPGREDFLSILKDVCGSSAVPFDSAGAEFLVSEFYGGGKRPFRGCHPGDIVRTLVDIASFRGVEPRLTRDQLQAACASYFVDPEADTPSG